MNNKISITTQQAIELDQAFVHFFPKLEDPNFIYGSDKSWKTPNGEFYWENRTAFMDFIQRLTGIQISETRLDTIKAANKKLHEIATTTPTPEYTESRTDQPAPTTPDQIGLEEKIEAMEKMEDQKAQRAESDEKVREAIERKKQLYQEEILKAQKQIKENISKTQSVQSELEGKKVYAKVEYEKTVRPTEEELNILEKYKVTARENPKYATEQLAQEIEKRTQEELIKQGLAPEEIKVSSVQTAEQVVENFKQMDTPDYTPVSTQIAIVRNAAINSKVIPKNISNEAKEVIKQSTANVAVYRFIPEKFAKDVTTLAFGKTFAGYVFGPDPENIKVTYSQTPSPEYTHQLDFGKVNRGYVDLETDHSQTLELIRGLGEDQAKIFLLQRAGGIIQNRIAALPAESVAGKIFQSAEAQSLLFSTFGVGKAVSWEAGNWFGGMALKFAPESAPFLSAFGKVVGVNFVKASAPAAVALATGGVEAAAISTGVVATEAIATTAGATVGAEAGATGAAVGQAAIPIPGLGAVIGLITGFIAGKILKPLLSKFSEWWTKNKDSLIPAIATGLLVGGLFFRNPFLLAGGVGLGATALATGGLGAIGAGIGGLFRGIRFIFASLIAPAVVTPFIITILVLPVLVAFIMFVINSGAYLVPPSPTTSSSGSVLISPYIDVIKTASPSGPFENSELPVSVEYTVTIKAKKGNLSNIKIFYKCDVVKEGSSVNCPIPEPAIPSPTNDDYPEVISPAQSYSFKYTHNFTSPDFIDTLTVDIITVTADAVGAPGVVAAGSAGVKIGNPPDTCPQVWPVEGSYTLTQTPGGSYSHSGIEAIDIATPEGVPVKATHSGIAKVVYTTNAYRPLYIDIISTCGATQFKSRYAHLSGSTIRDGDQVLMGQTIGYTGSDGTGPHLHYEFIGLRMDVPYIPKPVKRNCSSSNCGSIP